MADIGLSYVIMTASTKSIKSTEYILQQFRSVCKSDEEFSKRMTTYRYENQPVNITQYYFDGLPVLFSKVEINKNKIIVTFHQGYWDAV